MRFESCVPASHPALPGHFPGTPIVPGVVLLSELEHEISARLNAEVVEWLHVKFLSPLTPGQRYTVETEYHPQANSTFRISREGTGATLVASGTLRTKQR
jgi:3-hydroxyacyl-[acyl-carrier-protein] dehydratase